MNPNLYRLLLGIIVILSLLQSSCTYDYERSIITWQQERIEELKAPYGWPSVVGLFWIRNSMAYFGSQEGNDFLLPETAPSGFGRIMDYDTAYYMIAYRSLKVQLNGESVTKVRMFTDKEEGGPSYASWKSLQWHIIERQDRAYLRVKDSLSIYRSNLKDIPYFAIDEAYNVPAKYTPADTSDRVSYKNILGMEFSDRFAGFLDFDLQGQNHRLVALDNDEDSYFVIFGDLTNDSATYGGGRYIYPKKANKDGLTYIDFNKAINPPCVFTPYATCPLPPEENRLPIAIVAGEKMIKLY